ncbi:phage late control D family protein [Pseudorhodoplanes sp.]|uniref:phage late control D family protein n=1 Tax=Pseudorhodoplanes sp. TaxID=1934341 RepID=UPI00391DF3D2
MAKRAFYRIMVSGQDISSRFNPLLIDIRISDREGTHSDTASIRLDDRDGRIALPRTGAPIAIMLGWEGAGAASVFVGTVDEVKSSGSRGGGRELTISAKGVDTEGTSKQPQQKHMDNKTVMEALQEAGRVAGITAIKVDPSFAGHRRDWWGLNEESFLHFGERLARELGGIFKVRGTEAILAAKGAGSATGLTTGSVTGRYGDNLISWDVSPTMGRPRHRRARARWYDQREAKWKDVEVDIQDQGARATMGDRFSRADRTEAQGSANNGAKDAEREKGGGSATIDGDAAAKPGGTFILSGTRPGIEGVYRIEGVEHAYSRAGWTTKLDLKQPQAGR